LRPVFVDAGEIASSVTAGSAALPRIGRHREWEAALTESENAFEQFQVARTRCVASQQAKWLRDAGIRFRPASFLLATRSRKEIEQSRREAATQLKDMDSSLARFEEVARRRLVDALRLAISDAADNSVASKQIVAALDEFRPVFERLGQLRDHFAVYSVLYPARKAHSPRTKANRLRLELSQTLRSQLNDLKPFLSKLLIPYGRHETLLARIERRLPDQELPFETMVYRDAAVYLEEIDVAYYSLMGTLCVTAQDAEQASTVESTTS
jgi:hypothetical protein